jgi:hypothetical protein
MIGAPFITILAISNGGASTPGNRMAQQRTSDPGTQPNRTEGPCALRKGCISRDQRAGPYSRLCAIGRAVAYASLRVE